MLGPGRYEPDITQGGLARENWSMSYERFPEDIVVVLPI
jgi:hypothetical protein